MSDLSSKTAEMNATFSSLFLSARSNPGQALADIGRMIKESKEDSRLAETFVTRGAEILEKTSINGGTLPLALLEGMIDIAGDNTELRLAALNAGCDLLPTAVKNWSDWNTVKLLQDILTGAGEDIARPHVFDGIYISKADQNGTQSFFYRSDLTDPQSPIHHIAGTFNGGGLEAVFQRASRRDFSSSVDVEDVRTTLSAGYNTPIKDAVERKLTLGF